MKIHCDDIFYSWQMYEDEIFDLEDIFGEDAWEGDDLIDELRKSDHVFGAFDGKKLIGYIASVTEGCQEYIWTFVVDTKYQGKGIGRQLLTEFLKHNEFCRLEVRMDNHVAIKLYQDFGFKIIDSKKGYYADGCDSLILEK